MWKAVQRRNTPPTRSTRGVIEIIVKKGARSRYSTIQNWSTNVYNLVTQRAKVFENASHEWVDANLGSKLTMKYPSCYLMEPGARGEMLSMAFAGPGQIQDAGGKMMHFAPNTTSKITSKSISKGGGRASYRGLVKVYKGAKGVKSNVVCDALLLDPKSRSDTYPSIEIDEDDVTIGHEASVCKVGEEQLFYLMSPRSQRRRSHHHGRLWFHRAAGQRIADGICCRNEPPDPIADGRIDRLSMARESQKLLIFQDFDSRRRMPAAKEVSFTRIAISAAQESHSVDPYRELSAWQGFRALTIPCRSPLMKPGAAPTSRLCPPTISSFQQKAHLKICLLCQKICSSRWLLTSTADRSS